MKVSIIFLRIAHGIFTVYFLLCLMYVYYCAITVQTNFGLKIAVVSLLFEGFLIFILNNGDCPLIHLQHKLGDDKPFFSLFLPKKDCKTSNSLFCTSHNTRTYLSSYKNINIFQNTSLLNPYYYPGVWIHGTSTK